MKRTQCKSWTLLLLLALICGLADAGGVVEMLLMMAGDVEPNPGPTMADVEEYSPEQAYNWLCGVTKGISTATLKIMEDKDISGRSLLGYLMLAGSNAINTLKEVLQVKDGEAAAIGYALKRLVDGDVMDTSEKAPTIKKTDETGDDPDGDPAIVFHLNSPQHIHDCLQMGAVVAGLPAFVPTLTAGAMLGLGTPQHQSYMNLINWLDNLINRYSQKAIRVQNAVGNIVPGSYQGISGGEYSTIISKLAALTTWQAQVIAGAESLGELVVFHGGGVGNETIIYMQIGPFNGRL